MHISLVVRVVVVIVEVVEDEKGWCHWWFISVVRICGGDVP